MNVITTCVDRITGRFSTNRSSAIMIGVSGALLLFGISQFLPKSDVPHVLASLCGTGVWLYVGMAIMVRPWWVSLVNVCMAGLIFAMALLSIEQSMVWLMAGFIMHAAWSGIQSFLHSNPDSTTKNYLAAWAIFSGLLAIHSAYILL